MSIQAQERLVTRLIVIMALAIAFSLLLVGWTLYRPGAPGIVTQDAQSTH